MESIRVTAQLIIAFGILNVWLLRFNKAGRLSEEHERGVRHLRVASVVYVVCWWPQSAARIIPARQFLVA